MSKYHFEDDENDFGETVRIDHIKEQVKNYQQQKDSDWNNPFQTASYSDSDRETKKTEHTQPNPSLKGTRQPSPTKENSWKSSDSTSRSTGKRSISGKKNRLSRSILIPIVLASVLIFTVVFYAAFSSTRSTPSLQDKPSSIEEENQTTPGGTIQTVETIALVKNINTSSELSLYDVKSQSNFYVKADSNTEITGRNNAPLRYNEIKVGDVIRISTDSEKKKALSITYCDQCLHKSGVTGVKFQPEAKTMSLDDGTYSYSEETIIKYGDKLMDIQDLEPIDVLTLNGYDKGVWSIMVEKYHGYLVVKNKEKIQDGTITIDSGQPISLSSQERIAVSTGAHRILIQGSNIESYTTDLYLTENERYEIDLSNMQTKTGVIIIKSNIYDYQLFVNGESVLDPSEPLVLPHGTYTIKITKEDYLDWEEEVSLQEASIELSAQILPMVKKLDLVITTNPPGCTILMDDEEIGISPNSFQIAHGEHRFIFKKEGYYDLSVPLSINETTLPLSVTLNKIPDSSLN